jgi:hypothetical protein
MSALQASMRHAVPGAGRRRGGWRRLAAVALLAFGAAACSEDTALPDPGPPSPFSRSEFYEGTLAPDGSGFYSFTIGTDGSVEITLLSLTDEASGAMLDETVTVGFGVPSGFDCATSATSPAAPALGPQITRSVAAGTYCARISDPDVLASPTDFIVRITIRTGSAPTPAPGTLSFASQVAVGGFTARSFTASVNGTLVARLESLTPDTARVGLGIGIPEVSGACAVTRQILMAGPGDEISIAVAGGNYCVTVFDPGTLAAPVAFSVRIDHP